MTTTKFPGQLRKGDKIVWLDGRPLPVLKVVPIMGGSWFDVHVKGFPNGPISYGNSEKIEVMR